MPKNDGMKEFLAQAQTEYRAALPEKLDSLEQWIARFERQPARCEEVKQMFDMVHRLSGTAGSFGLDAIGGIADEWERAIRELCKRDAVPRDFTAMRAYLDRIRELL